MTLTLEGFEKTLVDDFRLTAPVKQWVEADHSIQSDEIKDKIIALSDAEFQEKEAHLGREVLAQFEKSVILQTMDSHWREHLAAMDHLRQGIHLRGYAQKDPKQEYKREAFSMFSEMLDSMRYEVIRLLSCVEIQTEDDIDAVEAQRKSDQNYKMEYHHDAPSESQAVEGGGVVENMPYKRQAKKVGRNEPCPCGSGKKFKACHGQIQ